MKLSHLFLLLLLPLAAGQAPVPAQSSGDLAKNDPVIARERQELPKPDPTVLKAIGAQLLSALPDPACVTGGQAIRVDLQHSSDLFGIALKYRIFPLGSKRPVGELLVIGADRSISYQVRLADRTPSSPKASKQVSPNLPALDAFVKRHWPGLSRTVRWEEKVPFIAKEMSPYKVDYSGTYRGLNTLGLELELRPSDGKVQSFYFWNFTEDTNARLAGQTIPPAPGNTVILADFEQQLLAKKEYQPYIPEGATFQILNLSRNYSRLQVGKPEFGFVQFFAILAQSKDYSTVFTGRYLEASKETQIEGAQYEPDLIMRRKPVPTATPTPSPTSGAQTLPPTL